MDDLQWLVRYLLEERQVQRNLPIQEELLFQWYRALVNIRPALPVSEEFLQREGRFLQAMLEQKGKVTIEEVEEIQPHLYLWRGDITRLAVDAIVNAANSQMLGCFYPYHGCIDNAIHTFAGVELRDACAHIMKQRGKEASIASAIITKGYHLPCHYVVHTVGPTVNGPLKKQHCEQLAACYRSCLMKAEQYDIKTIAFCCISTGEFHFPNDIAAQIAIASVVSFLRETKSEMKVIFNVFKQQDEAIYRSVFASSILY